MSLKQDGLDLRVEASRPDTARMLQGDQDTLAKLLTSAGYRIDGMAVVAAPTDGAAVPDGRSQAFLPSSTPQQGSSSQSDSRSSGGRPNAEPDPRASRGNQNDDSTTRAALCAALAAIFMCSAPAARLRPTTPASGRWRARRSPTASRSGFSTPSA